MTKDKWGGNSNQPMTFNRWNYVQSNPTNLIDPSGYRGCTREPPSKNSEYIETNVAPFLKKWNWLDTYTAAGIAVQCWRDKWPWTINDDDPYGAIGPGQITTKQAETPYGEYIENPKNPGHESDNRGYGLLCYIVNKAVSSFAVTTLCVCDNEKSIQEKVASGEYVSYREEKPLDPSTMSGAVELMKRRIKLVTDKCLAKGCSETDVYIAAALAQNGSGFTIFNLDNWLLVNKNRFYDFEKGITIDWFEWFRSGQDIDTTEQLRRFKSATDSLTTWYYPREVNNNTVRELINTH